MDSSIVERYLRKKENGKATMEKKGDRFIITFTVYNRDTQAAEYEKAVVFMDDMASERSGMNETRKLLKDLIDKYDLVIAEMAAL